MKIKSIYDAALRLLGHTADDGSDADYAERTPYIAATFCCEAAAIDRDYRESHKIGEQKNFSQIYLGLEDDFPLCSRFTSAAAYYIAAMLVLEENELLSDSFFEKYCDSLSAAVSETTGTCGKIKDVYLQ